MTEAGFVDPCSALRPGATRDAKRHGRVGIVLSFAGCSSCSDDEQPPCGTTVPWGIRNRKIDLARQIAERPIRVMGYLDALSGRIDGRDPHSPTSPM